MDFKYPYTDFHELNLDWFMARFKELVEEWNSVKEDWNSLHDYVENYFNNLNVQNEINNKMDALVADGTLATIMEPYIDIALPSVVDGKLPDVVAAQISAVVAAQISAVVADQLPAVAATQVAAWLATHIDPDTGYVIDDTLTITDAAADAKVAGDDLRNLITYNTYDVLADYVGTDGTHNGVTYSFNGNTCTTTGSTGASESYRNIYNDHSHLPFGLKAGDKVNFKISSTNPKVRIDVFWYDSNNQWINPILHLYVDNEKIIPSNAVGAIIRVGVPANVADASGTITYSVIKTSFDQGYTDTLYAKTLHMEGILPDLTDANNVVDPAFYLIDSGNTYTNLPITVGFLAVYRPTTNSKLQVAYDWLSSKVYKRRASGSTWNDWELIGNNIINNYQYDSYSNTYNITASPTITTDTNAYLAPSGDTTDRTADIVALLTAQGVCRLGKGDYYVTDLVMPKNTSIIGSGYQSRIILSGSGAGFAVKMDNYCTVEDCQIVGSTSVVTPSATVGDRHGILWQGNYSQDPTPGNQPTNGMVNNVRISRFTGGGITCYDTGYGTYNALEVCNVYCSSCSAGINIAYWSEFHKFTNVRTANCYYGCINNGGNNVFVNCDFSTCKLAFLIDNSQSQSPNAAHGSCVGCVFNHTDSNTGVGISILNTMAGFIFDGCQLFYSQINIEDSEGIVFTGCNFGDTNCNITIDGGGAILFIGNMFKADVPKTITDNTHVVFANCYVKSTGVPVTNS